MQIIDGDRENPVRNYTYCGTSQQLDNIYSTSNKVFIRFKSDFIVTSNGFMIQYRQRMHIIDIFLNNHKKTWYLFKELNICKTKHDCEHRCINEQKSYRCECNEGFVLSSNGKSCIGIH